MDRLSPRSLAVAVAVADTGSVSKAAGVLGLAQPSVSYHLRKLEDALGAPLFGRGAAGLTPTPVGRALVARGRSLLAELDRLHADLRALASGRGDTVRVSSACFTNYHWLPGVLQTLRAEHGPVRVDLDVDPSRRPFEALAAGALDLALTTVPPEGGAYTLHRLFDDEIVAVMEPAHPLASRPWLAPEDFADESVIVFDRARSDLFTLALEPAGVTPRVVTDMPVTEAILELVRAGMAITAMASWVARPELDSGRLAAVRIGPDGLHRTWWAVVSARRPTSPAVEAFLHVLRDHCAAAPALSA